MDKSKDLILITGITGQQGGVTARELLAKGFKLRGLTRNPAGDAARAFAKQGVEMVKGDLDDAASLQAALKGVWGVHAVQNTWTAGVEGEEVQGKRTAELAKKAGVQHFVYASVASAHRKTGIPHFDNKARVEATVRALGFPSYTIVRPVFFMENLVSPWFKPAIDNGQLAVGMKPATVLQMIALDDIGKYTAAAFERYAELNGAGLDIAGDQLTMPQAAAVLSRVTGRKIEFFPVPIAEVRKASDDFATMLEWFDRVGYDADIPGNASKFGIKPTTFAEWAARQAW